MTNAVRDKWSTLLLALLALLVLVACAASFRWRMVHDSPIYFYTAYLMNHWDLVPYRDFFDVNMPGVHWIHSLVGAVFGYGDLGFRVADILVLAATSAVTVQLMRRLGGRAAVLAAVIFGLHYLSLGPYHSFQRDYLLILPVTAALLVATSAAGKHDRWGGFLTGALFGIAFTLKPTAVIGYPFVVVYQIVEAWRGAGEARKWTHMLLSVAVPGAFGVLLPVAAMLAGLLLSGSLPGFLAVVQDYWPLYRSMTGSFATGLGGIQYQGYLVGKLLEFGGLGLLVVPAILGFYVAHSSSQLSGSQKRLVSLLGAMAVAHALYVGVAGKFWPYHWLPFSHSVGLLASLCLITQAPATGRLQAAFPKVLAFVCVVLLLAPPNLALLTVHASQTRTPKGGRVDVMADFLREKLRPGDTVQALDWTGGAVHAMLIARARTATPYLYDVMFYQQAGSPYTTKLRREFMGLMKARRPRFVIEVVTNKPWPRGQGTTREFVELRRLLDEHYAVRLHGSGFQIHERSH